MPSVTGDFQTVGRDHTLKQTGTIEASPPLRHLASLVMVTIAVLDLCAVYQRCGLRSGQPYAPKILVALLLKGSRRGDSVCARLTGRPTNRVRSPS